MKAKVLFFDDIFSERFRSKLNPEHLAFDDNWAAAVGKALTEDSGVGDVRFELVRRGEIGKWQEIIREEKPDILLLDLLWPEEAQAKYKDRSRGADVSLEALPKIRKAFPDLPVVCYTVKPDRELYREAYRRGATFFLEKLPLPLPEVQTPLKYVLLYLLRQVGKGG
ncbi:MAG: response regulator [bacterium]